jgi:hypothetical protein
LPKEAHGLKTLYAENKPANAHGSSKQGTQKISISPTQKAKDKGVGEAIQSPAARTLGAGIRYPFAVEHRRKVGAAVHARTRTRRSLLKPAFHA